MYFITVSYIILKANLHLVTFSILLSQICSGNNANIREYYGALIKPPVTTIPKVDELLRMSDVESRIECLSLCVMYSKCLIIMYSVSERLCILRKITLIPDASSFMDIPATSIHYMLQAPECPTSDGYIYQPELRLCFKIGSTKNTWEEAADSCNNDRGQLIHIDKLEVSNYLKSLLGASSVYKHEWFYFGLCKDEKGAFVWQNGQALTYIDWKSTSPDNSGGHQNCVSLDPGNGFQWNDVNCDNPFGIQICEIVVR